MVPFGMFSLRRWCLVSCVVSLWQDPSRCWRPTVPLREERARRIVEAIQQNLDNWIEAVAEIESHAIPGNKQRCLHLQRSLEQAKHSLEQIMRSAGEG